MSVILHHKVDPYVLEFELKGLPKMTNSLKASAWQVRHAHSKKWKEWVKLTVCRYVPEEPLKKAKLTLVRCSAKECDFDGLVSGFKHIVDALVEVRVLENDKQSNIGQPVYSWQSAKQREGKIIVKVEGV